ncbi:hypothetical protein GCK32_010571 [Trichostrongylus colubriformis]|uniref:Uncharacterized protein n=1 Tax=Trichostrongylus colubriformis TaxID=6319 RepID=A0AAN8GE26_TRICO
MNACDSEFRRKYKRLLQAIPTLPTPTQLYKKIVHACRQLHGTTQDMTPLVDRLKNLRSSREGWKECLTALQILESLRDKQALVFKLIRNELRTLFAVPSLLIATEKISESNWRAIMSQPQYDEYDNPILMKQSAIETVIADQLKILDEQQSFLNDFRRTLQEEERTESQNFQTAILSSLDEIQKKMEQSLEKTAKESMDDSIAALWSQPRKRLQRCYKESFIGMQYRLP